MLRNLKEVLLVIALSRHCINARSFVIKMKNATQSPTVLLMVGATWKTNALLLLSHRKKSVCTEPTIKIAKVKHFCPIRGFNVAHKQIYDSLSDVSYCFVNDCFILILDSCPSQYAKIAGLCIYVSSKNEKKNYADAKEYCKSINGKLYEPRNRGQYETLRTYLEVITCLSNRY